MIKLLLKHTIANEAINAFFDKMINNFAYTSDDSNDPRNFKVGERFRKLVYYHHQLAFTYSLVDAYIHVPIYSHAIGECEYIWIQPNSGNGFISDLNTFIFDINEITMIKVIR